MDKMSSVLKDLSLGEMTETPARIFGGLLHKMYQVKTDQGIYAVKLLNPEIMKRETVMANYELSERFCNHAIEKGLPAVSALEIDNQFIHTGDHGKIQIFPWVQGVPGTGIEINPEIAGQIGDLLFRIHDLQYREINTHTETFATIDWQHYLGAFEKRNHVLYSSLKEHLKELREIEYKCMKASELLEDDVISHRDLDPKNTLWDEEMNPTIIDWESTGWTNKYVELLEVAMSWSKKGKDAPSFIALLKTYNRSKQIDKSKLKDAIYASIKGHFVWLEYNMKRAIGLEVSSKEEQMLGEKEVKSTILGIVEYAGRVTHIEDMIEKM